MISWREAARAWHVAGDQLEGPGPEEARPATFDIIVYVIVCVVL